MQLVLALRLSALAIVVLAGRGLAAPVLPSDAPANGAIDGAARESRPQTPVPPGGARTIDLLIEMQPKSAGLEFNHRARAAARTPAPLPAMGAGRAASAASAGPVNASGLFGSGATPPVVSRRVSAASNWKPDGDRATSGSSAAGGRANDEMGSRWLRLPRDAIAFVRENRELVVAGALALLALFWGGSIAAARSRR